MALLEAIAAQLAKLDRSLAERAYRWLSRILVDSKGGFPVS
jgi:hypothetical protein